MEHVGQQQKNNSREYVRNINDEESWGNISSNADQELRIPTHNKNDQTIDPRPSYHNNKFLNKKINTGSMRSQPKQNPNKNFNPMRKKNTDQELAQNTNKYRESYHNKKQYSPLSSGIYQDKEIKHRNRELTQSAIYEIDAFDKVRVDQATIEFKPANLNDPTIRDAPSDRKSPKATALLKSFYDMWPKLIKYVMHYTNFNYLAIYLGPGDYRLLDPYNAILSPITQPYVIELVLNSMTFPLKRNVSVSIKTDVDPTYFVKFVYIYDCVVIIKNNVNSPEHNYVVFSMANHFYIFEAFEDRGPVFIRSKWEYIELRLRNTLGTNGRNNLYIKIYPFLYKTLRTTMSLIRTMNTDPEIFVNHSNTGMYVHNNSGQPIEITNPEKFKIGKTRGPKYRGPFLEYIDQITDAMTIQSEWDICESPRQAETISDIRRPLFDKKRTYVDKNGKLCFIADISRIKEKEYSRLNSLEGL